MNQQLAKQIEQLERKLLESGVRKSAEEIEKLLADDYFEFGMSGKRYSKQDIVELLPNSNDTQYKGQDFEAKEISPDTVLLTYRALVENLNTGEKQWTLRSSLWQKQGDNWRMIFHQGTKVE